MTSTDFLVYDKMYLLMDKENIFAWADQLEKERIAKGLSQSELARKAGISRQIVSDYEGYRRKNPDIRFLRKLSLALGHDEEYFSRLAGLVSQGVQLDENELRANHLINSLRKESSKQRAIDYLELLIQQEEREEQERVAKNNKNHPATQPR